MEIRYSTYDAKARFSEVIRHVREGRTVMVSYRGEPVAEIRPIGRESQTMEDRLHELEQRGVLERSRGPRRPFTMVERRPGALDRFLAERDG